MAHLLACPFCRQLYRAGETDGDCPDCGVGLERFEKLPPSLDAIAEEAPWAEPVAPGDRRLPWTHWGRGRAVLALVALLGLLGFLLPWVELHLPQEESFSGLELARHRLGWMWGGAVGWFITVPLIITRRSVNQMRGVRVILTVFAAMTLIEVGVLLAFPPRPSPLQVFEFEWGSGFYLSAVVSGLGIASAIGFGGRADSSRPARPHEDPLDPSAPTHQSSHGRTLH